MTVETQMLRALQRGRMFTLPGLRRLAYCTESRALKAVRVLMALNLIDAGQYGARRRIYFLTRRRVRPAQEAA